MKNYQSAPSDCNCLNLRRASLSITKLYDEKISASGLTISQFAILKHIHKHGGALSVSDLAVILKLDRTTLVRSLRPLEESSLIVDISESRTRNRQLQLTEEGLKKYKEADILWENAQKHVEEKIGKENLEQLTTLLSMIESM